MPSIMPTTMPTSISTTARPSAGVPLEQVRSAPNWRARFFEAAANASVALVEYSLRHQDSAHAAIWMERLEFFREKASLYS